MFGFGKKQIAVKKERVYPTNNENEQMIMRLFDFGFLGKPSYYSNGDIETGYGLKIWKPIDPTTRLYVHGLTGILPQSYRFQICKNNGDGWLIHNEDYIFIESLDDLDIKIIEELERIMKHHEEIVEYFKSVRDVLNNKPKLEKVE